MIRGLGVGLIYVRIQSLGVWRRATICGGFPVQGLGRVFVYGEGLSHISRPELPHHDFVEDLGCSAWVSQRVHIYYHYGIRSQKTIHIMVLGA